MKWTYILSFVFISCVGFSQQDTQPRKNRTTYHYLISQVSDEESLQQVINEINSYKNVSDCKYRLKPEKKMAEISFSVEEPQVKSEKEISDIPDAKNIIIKNGLQYNSFTYHTEKLEN